MKRRLHEILELTRPRDRAGRAVAAGIVGLIVLNVVASVLETVESVHAAARGLFGAIEVASIALFTLEYLLRLWTATEDPRFARPVAGRLRWAATPAALVDLMAIAPAYLPWLGIDLRFVRAVRLARVFRLAKLGRYSRTAKLLGRVVRKKQEELAIALLMLVFTLLFAGSLMYYAEHAAQPETFSSIPASFWWAIATLTTVGYGDIVPVTGPGKLLGAVIAVAGIGLFALPAGILGAGFLEEVQARREPRTCPHCGKPL
jgi:voltage-gated potassium channel